MSLIKHAGQSLGFLLLSSCLRWTAGELVDVRKAAVRRGLLRFQFSRLMKVAERLRILTGALSFASERKGCEIKQIGGRLILRIEFVRVLEFPIRRKIIIVNVNNWIIDDRSL
ncbi:MAG TPA: hypothetical protein VE957_17265 [Terriglobales bacterium]|nr:hypothetical protein [Terriglobales bacterium]